jgi:hypothetical protein
VANSSRPGLCGSPAERGESITFRLLPGDQLDVDEFKSLCTPRAPEPPRHTLRASRLQRAIDLYRADLVEDIYDDWALLEREQLREQYLSVLERLITLYKQACDYGQALLCAQRLAAADPLRESAHCELMRLYHLLGRSQAALEQFAALSDLLARELDAPPSLATVALRNQIAAVLTQSAESPHLPMPPPPPLLRDLASLRVPFVGRTGERKTLLSALLAAIRGHGGPTVIEGDAGVGKTRLAQEIIVDAQWHGCQVGLLIKTSQHVPINCQRGG